MFRKRIGISILDCNLMNVERELCDLKKNGVTNIHIDIMDTTFVENITFGPSMVNRMVSSDFVFDVHVMVDSPLRIIAQLDLENVSLVTIHQEASGKEEAFEYLRDRGVLVGLAINPRTSVEAVNMEGVDFVLIMSVEPGFGGQRFMEESVGKIDKARKQGKIVGVDGGVNGMNIGKLVDVDYVVIGSAYFSSKDKRGFMEAVRSKFLG